MSNKPFKRAQVPMRESTWSIYKAYADARGASVAHVCGELLEQAAPSIETMTVAIQEAQNAPARAIKTMVEEMRARTREVDQMALDMDPMPKTHDGTSRRRK